jgi:hypothetical protein
MSIETWADREDHREPRAAMMRCPCCGKQRTADSIVRVAAVATVRSAARTRFSLPALPEYLCTAQLATLVREGIVAKGDLPNRRRP